MKISELLIGPTFLALLLFPPPLSANGEAGQTGPESVSKTEPETVAGPQEERLQKKRLALAAKLYEIMFLGGDHLGYAEEMLGYLRDKRGVSSADLPRHLRKRARGLYEERRRSRRRRDDIDLFSLISGGLAIRESLQTETIRSAGGVEESTIPVSTLKRPIIKSHPFQEMLKGRSFKINDIANLVPEENYYVHFANLKKGLEFFDYLEEVGGSFYNRYEPLAVDFAVKQKILDQLAVRVTFLGRKLSGFVIDEMALTGSDPFIRSGSDVTLIFKLGSPGLFKSTIKGFREHYKETFKAKSEDLSVVGIKANFIGTEDRRVHSYMMELPDNRVLISNSRAALENIVRTYRGDRPALAKAWDFKYMRSIYPADPEKEDAFVYLSDAFIRRLVGPEIRIKEARRMRESLRLAELERHILFYFQLYGKLPGVTPDLAREFGREKTLAWAGTKPSPNSFAARSEKFGPLGRMVPNLDWRLEKVTASEARGYNRFLSEYNNFWREFFDPIGVRIKFDGKVKIETCILPLIDNSIYNNLTRLIGGAPIDLAPSKNTIKGEVLSVAVKIQREFLEKFQEELIREIRGYNRGGQEKFPEVRLDRIFRGEFQMHMLDARPLVDFDSGLVAREMVDRPRGYKLFIGVLVWSLFHPLRLTIPLRDEGEARRLLSFVESKIARELNRGGDLRSDIYSVKYKKAKINVLKISFEDILKFRFYYTINKKELIVTTTKDYIQRYMDAQEEENSLTARCLNPGIFTRGDSSGDKRKGNVSAVYRPSQMEQERDLYVFNILEEAKEASFSNFGTFRLFHDLFGKEDLAAKSLLNFGFKLKCPAGGEYEFNAGTGQVSSTIFGTPDNALIDVSRMGGEGLNRFFTTEEIGLTLEFTPEGIKTVVRTR